MTRIFTFTTDHMIRRREIELVVTYSITPGRAEQGPTYACGGQPAEPDEVEITSITHDGQPFDLTVAEEDALLEQAIARAGDDMAEEADDEADYRYEQYRDRQMMDRSEREA